ncbi:MAG TPA: DUF5615 family PIN-like protein [Acidimicrobiales bacterium]|nr:DUF5615 family PIN-like protein [Acidimicrobiales bacterium]
MRFLIDEMFGAETARLVTKARHDAVHVRERGLNGSTDAQVLAYAVAEDRVVVTENAVDFVPLLDERAAAGAALVPVVIVLKRTLPRAAAAMHRDLADRVVRWARAEPEPYRHVHWLG